MLTRKELLLGVGLDMALGDPQWIPHPVRGIGFIASHAERLFRKTALPLRLSGALFALAVVGVSLACVRLTLPAARLYWIYSLLACRDLDLQSASVIHALDREELQTARDRLSFIVGRDTAHLEETEIARAVIETVAENASDAVVAPLFYLALGGPLAMALYKVINTLDSMVGYRNERYREFGWFSARADDLLNFVPARLTALLVWLVALLPGFSARRSAFITLRDGNSQPSPNSGYPEAAFAGALGVRLGGLNYYRGVPSLKHYLGDAQRPLDRSLYRRTRTLLYGSTVLMAALLCMLPARKRELCR